MRPLLDITAARVVIDGVFAEPRLAHPEGVAIHRDGSIWCGTENGDLIRVEPDGSGMKLIGSTGGFLLGLAFDRHDRCYAMGPYRWVLLGRPSPLSPSAPAPSPCARR